MAVIIRSGPRRSRRETITTVDIAPSTLTGRDPMSLIPTGNIYELIGATGGTTSPRGTGSGGGGGGEVIPQDPMTLIPTGDISKVIIDKPTAPVQQIPVGFTGRVAQTFEGQPVQTRFFRRGEEAGRIITPVGEEPTAITKTPSRFIFKREGITQEVTFRETGAEVISRVGVEVPAVFPTLVTKESEARLKEERRQERLGGITERQQVPFGERIKFAYESTGHEGFSIRGGIRAGFEIGQIGFEKIFGTDVKKLGVLGMPISSTIPESMALGIFLLGPTTATSGQIQRELFEVSRVKLVGVTQTIGKGGVITKAAFKVTRAGRSIKGVVSAKSIQQQQGIITAAKGKTFVKGIRFPTGKEVIRVGKTFKTLEFAKVTQRDGLFFTRAMGVVRTGGQRFPFRAGGISIQRGPFVQQIGAVVTPRGTTFTRGILKIKTGVPGTTFKTTSVSGKANLQQIMGSSQLKSIGIQRTKAAVGAGVPIPPQQPIQILPVVSAQTFTTQIPRVITLPQAVTTKQITIPKQKVAQITTPVQRVSGRQRYVQRQVVTQVPAQAVAQKPILKTAQINVQQLLQRQLLIPRAISFQRTIQKPIPFISTIPIPKPPVKPPIVPVFFGKARGIPTGRRGFPVLLRRFGKFRVIGVGKTPGQAITIGREAAARTLGATFKVPGAKITKLPKFRTKKTKEGEILFIEKRKYRLSRPTERAEIQFFKRIGGRK